MSRPYLIFIYIDTSFVPPDRNIQFLITELKEHLLEKRQDDIDLDAIEMSPEGASVETAAIIGTIAAAIMGTIAIPGIEREFDSFAELADEFSLICGFDGDSRLTEISIHQKVEQINLRKFVVKKIKKVAGWILYNTLPNSYKEEAVYQFTEDSKLSNHSFLKDLVSYFVGGIEYRFKKIVRGFVSTVIRFLKSSSYFLRTKVWRLFLFGIIPTNRLIPNYPYCKLNEEVYWR